MDITITMLNGRSETLRVNPNSTVGSLKKLIEGKLEVSVSTQKLVYENGQRIFLNDDSRTLNSYGIPPDSRIHLLVTEPVPPKTIQVFLKNDKGKTSTYDITVDETVEKFKTRVEHREGVAVSQQRLIHESREMSGGKLQDYGVREHSTIFLNLRLRGG
ncbi:polyubiquitin-B-like [Cololabis saira]|uniref:polyubiquitin-B-like n=1 Tax=Cololabis saira TaxID=129043 RepID=UPI002AD519FD|nr:polyubiquitin-B-like [Cololabis saira]